jgi:GNAT superfamily N-acetyltransferase
VSGTTSLSREYWELRRLFCNAMLAIVVTAHFVAAWPQSRASVTLDAPTIGRVRHLYVLLAHRRRGVARRLMAEVAAAATTSPTARTSWSCARMRPL